MTVEHDWVIGWNQNIVNVPRKKFGNLIFVKKIIFITTFND